MTKRSTPKSSFNIAYAIMEVNRYFVLYRQPNRRATEPALRKYSYTCDFQRANDAFVLLSLELKTAVSHFHIDAFGVQNEVHRKQKNVKLKNVKLQSQGFLMQKFAVLTNAVEK